MTSKRRLSVALAALLCATACGGTAPPSAPGASASLPMPAHAAVGRAAVQSGGSSNSTGCDPAASLRPPVSMPSPGNMPAGSTMAKIQARGHLTVGVDQTTYLFGYRNPATGTIEGFDIDLARQVTRAIFGDPAALQLKIITNAQRIPMLQSGTVDMVAHSMTMDCDRWKQVDFSTAYLSVGKQLLVRKNSGIHDLADLAGRRACSAQRTSGATAILEAPSRPTPVVVDNWTDCLVLLQQNQVDAIVTDSGVLAGLVFQDPNSEIVGQPFTHDLYGLAFSKNTPDFVRFVNGVLARLRSDGTLSARYAYWLAPHIAGAPVPPPVRYSD